MIICDAAVVRRGSKPFGANERSQCVDRERWPSRLLPSTVHINLILETLHGVRICSVCVCVLGGGGCVCV